MPQKHVRLVLLHNWIITFAIAFASTSFLSVVCSASPPADKKSRFVLVGEKRIASAPSQEKEPPELVVSGSGVDESKSDNPPLATRKSAANEQPTNEFSKESSRKTLAEKPANGTSDRKLRMSFGSNVETGGNVAKEKKAETAQPSSPHSKSIRPGIEEQQAKDSGEHLGGSNKNTLAEDSHDDVPLTQVEHPYDAPAAQSEISEPISPKAAKSTDQLTAQQLVLKRRINDCLSYYMQHPESVVRRSPWAVMHAALPFGAEAELVAGNRKVNAIGWMCFNGVCKTQRLFQPTRTGFRTNVGPGVQGHEGQFLAILAQSHISHTYPLRIGEKQYKIADLVRYEMATCREKSELTFKLIGLSYYLHPQQSWRDNQGRSWTLEKMVAEELDQPIVGAACGGTHRLMGFSFSLAQRRRAGLPMTGHWERAEQYMDDFVNYAISLQNPDGSFSTDWFERRANDPNMEKKVQTTGHILEWLIFTVPQEELQSPPVERAVSYILDQISDNKERDWPIGPLGHSLRALTLYNQRVFGATNGQLKSFLAGLESQTPRR